MQAWKLYRMADELQIPPDAFKTSHTHLADLIVLSHRLDAGYTILPRQQHERKRVCQTPRRVTSRAEPSRQSPTWPRAIFSLTSRSLSRVSLLFLKPWASLASSLRSRSRSRARSLRISSRRSLSARSDGVSLPDGGGGGGMSSCDQQV